MKFNNRQNELVTANDGRKFFISRAVAVVPQILCQVGQEHFVLLNQRGPGCPDNVGKWVLPCGYLDWDESANDAVVREVWEECGFNLRGPGFKLETGQTNVSPWKVVTIPSEDHKQNILLHIAVKISAERLPELSTENDKHNEVVDVRWVPIAEAVEMDLAFGHQDAIKELDSRC